MQKYFKLTIGLLGCVLGASLDGAVAPSASKGDLSLYALLRLKGLVVSDSRQAPAPEGKELKFECLDKYIKEERPCLGKEHYFGGHGHRMFCKIGNIFYLMNLECSIAIMPISVMLFGGDFTIFSCSSYQFERFLQDYICEVTSHEEASGRLCSGAFDETLEKFFKQGLVQICTGFLRQENRFVDIKDLIYGKNLDCLLLTQKQLEDPEELDRILATPVCHLFAIDHKDGKPACIYFYEKNSKSLIKIPNLKTGEEVYSKHGFYKVVPA